MTDRTLSRRTVLGGAVSGAARSRHPSVLRRRTRGAPRRLTDRRAQRPAHALHQRALPRAEAALARPPVADDAGADCGETSYRGSGRLTGRRALVTGGGDSGIGRGGGDRLRARGRGTSRSTIIPTSNRTPRTFAKLIREAGRKAVLLPADIRTLEACEGIVRQAVEALGGLDLLVNNAAYQQSKTDISEISDEQFVRTYETQRLPHVPRLEGGDPSLPPGGVIIHTISQLLRPRRGADRTTPRRRRRS